MINVCINKTQKSRVIAQKLYLEILRKKLHRRHKRCTGRCVIFKLLQVFVPSERTAE